MDDPIAAHGARKWELDHAVSFRVWRDSGDSLAHRQLRSFVHAIKGLVEEWVIDPSLAEAVGEQLSPVLHCCDSLSFDTDPLALAYLMQHGASRYDRVTRVMEQLFALGHIPLRRKRLKVLDVGAGPASALYAVGDFYDDLLVWARQTGCEPQFVLVTHPHALDAGPAWGHLIHHFSERLVMERGRAQRSGSRITFGVTHGEFQKFSVRSQHIRSREAEIRLVQEEFDAVDEPISRAIAQKIATDEKKEFWLPSAYDIIIIGNFLTSSAITERFSQELQELSRSLTPGGILILLGGTGGQYPAVWSTIARLIRGGSAGKLLALSTPLDTNDSPDRAELVRGQMFDTMRHVVETCAGDAGRRIEQELEILPRESFIKQRFPKFQVQCWKNQWHSTSPTGRRWSGTRC